MPRAVHVAVACALGSGVLMLYARPLGAMVGQWNASPMYSYAFTVPLISLYVLWSRRHDLVARPPSPARIAGGLVLAAALLLLTLGQVAAIQVAEQLSFVVALAGLVLLLFGTRYLRVAAPALGYLLFMIPFWDTFTEPLHWPFQNNSASLGVAMLHGLGIPAYREGTVIALPNVTIEVARACSGVNYLVAVLALALPLSFLRLDDWKRRAVLIVSALAIAALANGLRVALIGALAYLEIGSPLHGPFHVLHGLFVAGVGYAVLFGGLRLLESRRSSDAAPAGAGAGARPITWRVSDASAMAVVFWTLAIVGTAPRSVPVALAMPLEDLPNELGRWSADLGAGAGAQSTAAWSGADATLRRRYIRRDGRSATVEIWYFEAQEQSREIVSFRAADLHNRSVTRAIPLPNGSRFSANLVTLPNEVRLFWYVLDGESESDQYAAKLRSLWTALSSGHSNGAAVMLRAASDTGREAGLASLEDLAAEIHQALGRHWHPPLSTSSAR